MSFETSTALIGALILVLALLVCYMALLLYKDPDLSPSEGFSPYTPYTPACSNPWLNERRGDCQGYTRGRMPSIDNAHFLPPDRGCCTASFGTALTHMAP